MRILSDQSGADQFEHTPCFTLRLVQLLHSAVRAEEAVTSRGDKIPGDKLLGEGTTEPSECCSMLKVGAISPAVLIQRDQRTFNTSSFSLSCAVNCL